ncbi:vomeronasal type-2 receptor 1-like [Ambystoma mexicanum]|uniref:vomeronasal type-2 receptor 1-like n=1 Tax=Ambystoma mexicanum TaxID=8296 RepID=UPI0037E7C389
MSPFTAQKTGPFCHLPTAEVSGLHREGDIQLGGIFPLHDDAEFQKTTFSMKPSPATCQRFRLQNYKSLQAMLFAIEEINKTPILLPNITLGYRIYDSCRMMQRSLEGTLWILGGQNESVPNFRCLENLLLMGIIGDAGSSCSIVMARLLGLYRFPQISFVSTSPLLSDRDQFPSFFRTIPNDDFQSRGLAQLLIHFGWTWVGLLVEDNDYGQHGAQLLKKELDKAGACIAFSENIILSRADRNAMHIIQVVRSSSAKVIVIFSSDAGLGLLVDEMKKHNVTGKIWVATEGWSISGPLALERYSEILLGTIGLASLNGKMQGFREHLNSIHHSRSAENGFLSIFWEEAFGCKWMDPTHTKSIWDNASQWCTGDERLNSVENEYNDVTNLRVAYNVYNGVYANAWALHELISSKRVGEPFINASWPASTIDFQPWQVLHYIRKVWFQNKDGDEVFFNRNGEVPARYDIVNWQRRSDGGMRQVTVGRYDHSAIYGRNLVINNSVIHWPSLGSEIPASVCSQSCLPGFRKAVREGEPVCCFLCVKCPQGEISNQTDSVSCLKCLWDHWPNARHERCIPKAKEYLSYEEPVGAILTAICLSASLIPLAIFGLFVLYKNTPIVKANNRSLSYLLLMSLVLCFLCSLSFIGYPSQEKCLLRQAAFGIIFALCISCILAKTLMVVIAFNATRPNSDLMRWVGPRCSYIVTSVSTLIQVFLCVCWLTAAPPSSEYNVHSQPGKIIIECNEGSPLAFWCMVGYLGLLATTSFIVAFLSRQLPDNFNEAKFITFSMLTFLSVWLSFIPAYLSTKGKYMVAMEVFAILTSSLALVSCIFFPKCYIILLRPEMNTKDHLMGRSTCSGMEPGGRVPINEVTGISSNGDIILGGIFPLHEDIVFQKTTYTVKPAPMSCQSDAHTTESPKATHNLKGGLINVRSLIAHASEIADIITCNQLDFLAVTETWLHKAAVPALMLAIPTNFVIFRKDRETSKGGGIAYICRDNLTIKETVSITMLSAELLSLKLEISTSRTITVHLIYRPSGSLGTFEEDLTTLLDTNVKPGTQIILLGDFNLGYNDPKDINASSIANTISEAGLTIRRPTHSKGHTLDWVTDINCVSLITAIEPCIWTDNYLISLTISDLPQPKSTKPYAPPAFTRCKENITLSNLLPLIQPITNYSSLIANPNDLAELYNNTINSAIDAIAPLKLTKSKPIAHLNTWFTPTLKALRKEKRHAEACWRKNPSPDNKNLLTTLTNSYKKQFIQAQKETFNDRIKKIKLLSDQEVLSEENGELTPDLPMGGYKHDPLADQEVLSEENGELDPDLPMGG